MPIVASREISSEREELVVIRTSDRMTFKRCRRLWGWMSHLKMGLALKEQADYFWFGSGIHYALEDFHGTNKYKHPAKAFLAYVEATRRHNSAPSNWNDHVPLGLGCMSYYADYWLQTRNPLGTMVVDGRPQLEVNGYIDLGVKHHGRRVVYGFTLDRMIVDDNGLLYVGEYKTAKTFRLYHYDTDEQCTAYCWAANRLYNLPIAGVYYYQFLKAVPQLPKILSNGNVSTDPRQPTTSALYRKGLLDVFGEMQFVPPANIKCLNIITAKEDGDQDRFIRRECIERNQDQVESFEARVHLELEDMLNDDLPLYPNQTKDCSWGCPLQTACIAMESGADYEDALSSYARHPQPTDTSWRKLLPRAKDVELPNSAIIYRNMMEEIRDATNEDHEPQITPEEHFIQEFM